MLLFGPLVAAAADAFVAGATAAVAVHNSH